MKPISLALLFALPVINCATSTSIKKDRFTGETIYRGTFFEGGGVSMLPGAVQKGSISGSYSIAVDAKGTITPLLRVGYVNSDIDHSLRKGSKLLLLLDGKQDSLTSIDADAPDVSTSGGKIKYSQTLSFVVEPAKIRTILSAKKIEFKLASIEIELSDFTRETLAQTLADFEAKAPATE